MSYLRDYPELEVLQSIIQRHKVPAYLVGGVLRDYYLNRLQTDFDFALQKDAIKIAKVFAKKIKGAFILLHEDHNCARVAKKKNGFVYTFDFAEFRAKTLRGDLRQRDFTVNTLCLNLETLTSDSDLGKVIAHQKKGLQDLKTKTIRMVSHKAFVQDPLRLLRAFSLQATLGFKIEKETRNQIKKDKDLLLSVATERIRDELFKILSSHRTANILKDMYRIGLLEKVIPQVTVMFNVPQSGYHHLNVWQHSLEAVVQFDALVQELKDHEDVMNYLKPRLALIKLGILLHDIGKPETRKLEPGGRMSFHGHEHVGKGIVRKVSKMLKLSVKHRHVLEDLVRYHLRPGYLSNFKKPSKKAIFRFLRDTGQESVSVVLLSLADQRATRGPLTTEKDQKHHEAICFQVIQEFFIKQKQEPHVKLLDGKDLMKVFKLQPGPVFSKILKHIEEQQDLGNIKTRKDALNLAKTLIV